MGHSWLREVETLNRSKNRQVDKNSEQNRSDGLYFC